MTSLPHTPATREPLTTLIAACFGDQSAPASPLPACDHTTGERWHDAVTQVGEQVRARLRVEVLPERLHKALTLVLAHAVTLHPDGTASAPPPVPPSTGTAAANGATPFCPLHQVAMEQRSNARGSWWSHWIASEQRYCKGK